MNKCERDSSCKKCNKDNLAERIIPSADGNIILYDRNEKKITYKVKNKTSYDV